MQPLPIIYKKNGYEYRQIYRDDMVTIYEQYDGDTRIAFEVCEIIKAPAGEVFGKWVEEREKLPSTEQWGAKAFTVKTLQDAIVKKNELRSRIIANRTEKATEQTL